VSSAADAAAVLRGVWRMTRRIVDHRQNLIGRMTGTAEITPDGDTGFIIREAGPLRFGEHVGPATRLYMLTDIAGSSGALTDAHGVTLARFDLTAPRAVFIHDCPPDRYAGRLAAPSVDRWRLVWRVTGPRKDLILATRFQRA